MTMDTVFQGRAPGGPGHLLGGGVARPPGRLERQIHLEGRPDAAGANDLDLAVVSLHDRSHDRQSEAEAARMAAAAGIRPGEAVEDAIEVLGRDPRPRVAERDRRHAVATTDADLDRVLLLG